jgi:hypothetical protein
MLASNMAMLFPEAATHFPAEFTQARRVPFPLIQVIDREVYGPNFISEWCPNDSYGRFCGLPPAARASAQLSELRTILALCSQERNQILLLCSQKTNEHSLQNVIQEVLY